MNSDSWLDKTSVWTLFAARLAFAMTVVLIPFRVRYILMERPAPPAYKDFTDFLLFGSDISVLVLLLFWFLSVLAARRSIGLGPKFIWFPMLGLCISGLLSAASSVDAALSFYHLLRLTVLCLFYLFVINEIRSPAWIVVAVAVQVVVQSVFALTQFFLQASIGLKALGEHELDPAVRGVSVVSDGVIRLLRAYGLAEHPNVLGGCLAFGLIILLACYLHGHNRTRAGILLVFLPGLLALLATFSRSAWLAFLAGAGLLVGVELISRRRHNVTSAVWLGLACILVSIPFVWNYSGFVGARLNYADSFERIPTETQSILGRRALNEMSLRIFLENPFDGVGLGASALATGRFYPADAGNSVPPHFVLLAVAMETGMAGAVSYLCLLTFPWFVLAYKRVNVSQKPFLTTASALLLAITLVGLFDIYPWLPPTGQLWHWLIWGLWSVAYEQGGMKVAALQMPKEQYKRMREAETRPTRMN
jgi:O-antigen ligase